MSEFTENRETVPTTLPEWLLLQAGQHPTGIALRHKHLGVWQVRSRSQVATQVLRLATALHLRGFTPGWWVTRYRKNTKAFFALLGINIQGWPDPGQWQPRPRTSAARVDGWINDGPQRGIARTFQNIALFKGMSVLDNVLCGRNLKRRSTWVEQALRLGRAAAEDDRQREDIHDFYLGGKGAAVNG